LRNNIHRIVFFWSGKAGFFSDIRGEEKGGMLSSGFLKTVEMLNRFFFPGHCGNAHRLREGFGYNNRKIIRFLCVMYRKTLEAMLILPSFTLARRRGNRYTDLSFRGIDLEESNPRGTGVQTPPDD
jgi:hypothetical protein